MWKEYETMLMEEEILWFQKSRSKWLVLRDQNSSHFHGIQLLEDKGIRWI